MINMYTKLLTIFTILSLMTVAYCKFSQPQTVEPFAGLVGFPGLKAVPQSYQQTPNGCQDIYNQNDQNPYNGDLMLSQNTVNPFVQNQQNQGLENPGVISENYNGPASFQTVPGTFESNVAPRFMPQGYGPNITYDLPNVDHLAADPADPLSLAGQVEEIEQTSNENYENVETKFAQVHEPVALPRTLDGRENFDNTDAPVDVVPQYKTYDRLVYAPARSRTSYQGDYIRGDLPIMPDPNQCGWFKSQHARPETSLNVGAMSVLFGGHSDVAKMVGGAVSGHNAPTPEGIDQADGLVQRVQSNPQLSNISGSGGVGVVGFA